MLELKNLLNRKTVKNFLDKQVDEEILNNAIKVAWKTPTSLNSKPIILLDISKHRKKGWIANQPAVATSPHLFLFAYNEDEGEANARSFLASRYGSEIGDARVEETIKRIVENKKEWSIQQVYLVGGYFATTLEASGVSGCFIAGFEKSECDKNVKLLQGYKSELIFACGYANEENDGSVKEKFEKNFEDFYFPNN